MQHRSAAIVTRPVSEIVLMKSLLISGVSRRARELPTAKLFSFRAIMGPIVRAPTCACSQLWCDSLQMAHLRDRAPETRRAPASDRLGHAGRTHANTKGRDREAG